MSLRPRCRADLRFVEQVYRGEQSFIVKDPATQKYFRFRPVEALVLQSFDGRTLGEIATTLAEEGYRLTVGALEGFARKLAGMGLLDRSLAERTTLELERLRAQRLQRRRRPFFRGEILRMRWSAGDPDAFLNRTLPALRWCFTPPFLAASVVLFATYFFVLAATWQAFGTAVKTLYAPSALTLGTVTIFWLTTVAVIGIHELGHAYTCKYFGGEVHEMGFMLIYFEPAFYCNVNDAWTFPELRARIWVTAAGSWIQFIVASLAALVWWTAVPGTLVSEFAVATMLIGGVTTIATNMNPLIPLDGYFALSDWLEIPNLRQRAFGYLSWAVKHHVLRLEVSEPPATDRERRVFLIYGGLATCYITGIFFFLAGLVLGWAGSLLGATGGLLVGLLILRLAWPPVAEWARAAAMSIRVHRAAWRTSPWRRRVLGAAAGLLLVLLLVPRWITVTGGFKAMPARSLVLVAPDSGIVRQVMAREGTRVPAGAALIRIQDLALEQERAARARAVDSLMVEQSRARAQGRGADAEQLDAERRTMAARLAEIDARLGALVLRARADGDVLTARPERLTGRRVESGDTLVTVADADSLDVRVTLAGAGATLVQPGQTVSLVTYASVGRPVLAVVRNVSPAAGLDPGKPGVEVRARIAIGGPWRMGVTGEASVRLRRSNLLGALWWGVRQRVRSDLLL
ncbi:MAG TPA: HlyD family efflux transporter periplasmic adaptor subunit [Gemmatimonadales bacterium]|nr:HlyD family efflux transporter periplasmic adaptor subunit [Gemmatimonadales bacterium]